MKNTAIEAKIIKQFDNKKNGCQLKIHLSII